jgi:hypothetical protein
MSAIVWSGWCSRVGDARTVYAERSPKLKARGRLAESGCRSALDSDTGLRTVGGIRPWCIHGRRLQAQA